MGIELDDVVEAAGAITAAVCVACGRRCGRAWVATPEERCPPLRPSAALLPPPPSSDSNPPSPSSVSLAYSSSPPSPPLTVEMCGDLTVILR